MGDVAKPSVRAFSQYGKIDDLVKEGDEDMHVYDQFSAPAIGAGTGSTENMVFVDGGHSFVSKSVIFGYFDEAADKMTCSLTAAMNSNAWSKT